MPDVIPSETYVHHTLQRSLQLPQILSPVPAQLPSNYMPATIEERVAIPEKPCIPMPYYSTPHHYNSLQRKSRSSCRSVTPSVGTGTLTRYTATPIPTGSFTLGRNAMSTLKCGNISADDQMNDAYYTYNAKRLRGPATTFN